MTCEEGLRLDPTAADPAAAIPERAGNIALKGTSFALVLPKEGGGV
jgi:hypothetical protein